MLNEAATGSIIHHPYFVWGTLLVLVMMAILIKSVFKSTSDEYVHRND